MAVLEDLLIQDLIGAPCNWELISYCAHLLQPAALKAEVVRLIRTTPRSSVIRHAELRDILASFATDWVDRDLYNTLKPPA